MLWVADKFEPLPENLLLGIFGSKIIEKNVGIQAPGPPRRDPGRNSVPDPGFKIPNDGMAAHLVAKRCDLGSLGGSGPASTPEPTHFETPHLSCIRFPFFVALFPSRGPPELADGEDFSELGTW